MNSLPESFVVDIISNGFIAIANQVALKARDMLKKKTLSQLLEKQVSLSSLLQRAEAAVSSNLTGAKGYDEQKVKLFLLSSEVDSIVRQVFASQILDPTSMQSIQAEFAASLGVYLGKSSDEVRKLADRLFETLVGACESVMAAAIDRGVLPAHEARSALRHRILLDELAAVEKNLAFLTNEVLPDVDSILEFEAKYRQQVAVRHGFITPPHFDSARRVQVDQLFVPPSFVPIRRRKGASPNAMTMEDLVTSAYRIVVLGNPGGGKSTFAHKLCYDLATAYPARLYGSRRVTPILVTLREYGAEKKQRKCSLVEFMEAMSNSRYQIKPPQKAFEYLLLSGRALVIFDGLDELLDTSYRQEISGDVEAFCTLYPTVPVLVTSREVGYEEAPLDEASFEVFRLSPFDDIQVREYASKWFSLDTDLSAEQRSQKAEGFLKESATVSDLRSNPLMLALMCNLYRGESYIPRNRPDLYEKCAVMLFERWDKGRGIYVTLPFEAHIRPAMMYLAHWIYSDSALQSGVSEADLVTKATEYLCPRRFEDLVEAEQAAQEFIRFCRGRSWVFTDTGTTKEGDRLYQFTHRTFLEYFTAAHLSRTLVTPEHLLSDLTDRITKAEWDVVAQLAFQIQNKNIEGAGDYLLQRLVTESQHLPPRAATNTISFAVRCLEFLVPSPRVTRLVTTAYLSHCIRWSLLAKSEDNPDLRDLVRRRGLTHALRSLLFSARENRPAITEAFESTLSDFVYNGRDEEAYAAMEIGLYPRVGSRPRLSEVATSKRIDDHWQSVSDRLYSAWQGRVLHLMPKYLRLGLEALLRGDVSLQEFVHYQGIRGIFAECDFVVFSGSTTISLAHQMINAFLRPSMNAPRGKILLECLRNVGDVLLSHPTPWVELDKTSLSRFYMWGVAEPIRGSRRIESDTSVLFGAFLLYAVQVEFVAPIGIQGEIIPRFKRRRNPVLDAFRATLLRRLESADHNKVERELDQAALSPEQKAFVWSWVRGETNLVGSHPGLFMVSEETTVGLAEEE